MTKISASTLVAAATANMKMPTGELGDLGVSVDQIRVFVENAVDPKYMPLDFSGQTPAGTLDGDEILPGIQAASNALITPDQIATLIQNAEANRQTASYTLVLDDGFPKFKLVEMNVGSANDLTIPPNIFPINQIIPVSQYGSGQTSFVAGVGVTIRSSSGLLTIPSQYFVCLLKQIATNEWYLWNGTPAVASPIGTHDIFIPAAAMWPRGTNGCNALTPRDMATSLIRIQTLNFDSTAQEFCQFIVTFPPNWNNGTVLARFDWTCNGGSASETVQFGIKAGAYSDGDDLTTALGTAQTVDDTRIGTDKRHLTDFTSAITIAGTPQDNDSIVFEISRNPASDNLSVDCEFKGVIIRITTDAATAS